MIYDDYKEKSNFTLALNEISHFFITSDDPPPPPPSFNMA